MFTRRDCAALLWAAAAFLAAELSLANAAVAEPAETLGRSVARLKKDKALKIGYFGGSITAGAGASNAAKTSWRALTTLWFKDRFPDAAITEINAAIGGTGSDLGAFRCQTDLLKHDPDLVFVEFAVNDGGGGELRVKRSMEGIVRQIWLANPYADVVFIYTTTKSLFPAYAKGELPKAVGYHQEVARHYGIPEINVGRVMAERIIKGDDSWETLTTDGVHPNDAGYALYMETIKAFLESHLSDPAGPALIDLPDPLTKDPFCGAHFEDATTLSAPGWKKEDKSLGGHYPHYIAASEPGTELVQRFSGTTIGVYWLIAPDSGDIEWSIDDGKPRRLSSWDKYALKYARANYAILADDLSSGEHTLKITVLGEKNAQSKGTWIRIGAFLVHCPC
jgi:lysophospholipase L1-like esterase